MRVKNPVSAYVPLESNPVAMVDSPGKEQARDRVFTKAEIVKLWRAFEQFGPLGAALQFQLATGQRVGEVLGLHEREIEGHDWTLPGRRSKTGLTHFVPLNDVALGVLERQRELGSDWLFPSRFPGLNQPARMGSKQMARIRDLSGVEDFASHHLRRTCATRMTRLGLTRFIVDRVLGHVDGTIGGRHYDRHEYAREKREALDQWGRWLAEAMGLSTNVVALERPA